MENKLVVLVGIPGSGKSTYANEVEDAIVLSSDQLRIELYGDVNHQESNGELFQELYKRAKEHLQQGKNVILDSTNISSKRRIGVVNEFKKYNKEVYYFNTPYETCLVRNKLRDRFVPQYVIDKMHKQLSIPTMSEGWDKVNLIHYKGEPVLYGKEYLESAISTCTSHDTLFSHLTVFPLFNNIYNMPQDSTYHSFSVSRHTYYVFDYIAQNYNNADRLEMLWAALLHDTGKYFCKSFVNYKGEKTRHASYISHELVSGQLACDFLYKIGYDDEFILRVVEIVQLHMKLLQCNDSEKAKKKLKDFVGEDVYKKLEFFREADTQAK